MSCVLRVSIFRWSDIDPGDPKTGPYVAVVDLIPDTSAGIEAVCGELLGVFLGDSSAELCAKLNAWPEFRLPERLTQPPSEPDRYPLVWTYPVH